MNTNGSALIELQFPLTEHTEHLSSIDDIIISFALIILKKHKIIFVFSTIS